MRCRRGRSSTYTASSAFVTLAGTASDDAGIAGLTWATDRGASGVASGTTAWTAQVPLAPGGTVITITTTDTDVPPRTPTATLTVTLNQISYYLAEGATGAFFDFDLLVGNPHSVEAPVTITFLRDDATTVTETRTLPPTSLAHDDPGQDARGTMRARIASTCAQAPSDVVARGIAAAWPSNSLPATGSEVKGTLRLIDPSLVFRQAVSGRR